MSKPLVSIIVAVARDGAIGLGGDLPFRLRGDMRHFRAVTTGHPVVMGRRTFESLPGGALPGRTNIVVTRQPGFEAPDTLVAANIDQALRMAADTGTDEIMIIGGGEIYRQTLPLASRVYLTEVDADVPDADTFFPALASDEWRVDSTEAAVDPNPLAPAYRFVTLNRI